MAGFYSVLKGVVTGILFAALMGVIVGLLVHLTTIPELGSTWGYVSLSLIIFGGAAFAAYREGKRGLLLGVEVAAIFILMLLIINYFFYPEQLLWKVVLVKICLAIGAGISGGAIGVAVKSR